MAVWKSIVTVVGLSLACAGPGLVSAAPETSKRSAKPVKVARVVKSAGRPKVLVKAQKVSSRKLAARQMARELDDTVVGGNLALRSSAALVLDQRSGEVLYEKNAVDVVPIASITKLMTAMVVLDAALELDQTLTISDDDVDRVKGSHSRLRVGSQLTREHAMLLALMSSENRAAHALGRNYPGGLPAFVEAMNRKAESLGMTRSKFVDPTGLSSANVSTAKDLSAMVAAAHTYPVIRELSTTPEAYVDTGGRRPVGYSNTNALVKGGKWEIGLSKTGYISEAGKCLVMQAWVAGRPTVMVLLDSNGRMTRIGDANRVKRWMETSGTLAARSTPRA